MIRHVAFVSVAVAVLFAGQPASAQDPPPPLPRVVVDLHALVPLFPNDNQQLADSRGLTVTELPGAGFGGRVGAHVYLLKFSAITLGVGGELLVGRSSSTPAEGTTGLVPVDERLNVAASQVSFNFGSGHGWSYLSGGFGRSRWSVRPSGQAETAADNEWLPTANYGGGARWFAKSHLAFSLDARVYEIQPGSPTRFGPGSPRTRLFVMGVGASLK